MAELVPFDPLRNDLAPNPDGRPLRSVTGNAIWKLVPPRARPLAKVLTVLPVGVFVGGMMGLAVWSGNFFVWWLMLGKGGVTKLGFLAAATAGMARFSARIVRWQLHRLAALHVTVASLRGCPPGSLVRVEGRVRAEAAFTAAVSGQPAVLAHYEARPESGASSHQVRGVDFFLDVDGSEAVRVEVAEAYFDDRDVHETVEPGQRGPHRPEGLRRALPRVAPGPGGQGRGGGRARARGRPEPARPAPAAPPPCASS